MISYLNHLLFSNGIGAATVIKLAQQNINVIINYNNNAIVAEQVAEQARSYGVQAETIRANVGNESEIIAMFEIIKQRWGLISYLVNNAAISDQTVNLMDINFNCMHDIFKINFFGLVVCCKEALKHMQANESNENAIVNISSEITKGGGNKMLPYATSKAAVNMFTKIIARTSVEYGVRINAVSPAIIEAGVHKDISQEQIKNLVRLVPMQRMGKSEEVADLIYFLLSEQSSYINGEVISINGGK